jgi:uncharacterized membrane protein
VALCLLSLGCDAAILGGGGAGWDLAALYTLAAGIVGGFLSALPELLAPSTRWRGRRLVRIALYGAALLLAVVNASARLSGGGVAAVALSIACLLLVAVSAWLGRPAVAATLSAAGRGA